MHKHYAPGNPVICHSLSRYTCGNHENSTYPVSWRHLAVKNVLPTVISFSVCRVTVDLELMHVSPTRNEDDPLDCISISSKASSSDAAVQISSESEFDLSPSRMIGQLKSNLSDYWQPEMSTGRVSRYGRHQKAKELEGYVPTELTRFVSKSDRPKKSKDIRDVRTPPPRMGPNAQSRSPTPNRYKEVITPVNITVIPVPDAAAHAYNSDVDSGRGSSIDFSHDANIYDIGTIHWTKFSSKCLWPCLVCPVPNENGKTCRSYVVYV